MIENKPSVDPPLFRGGVGSCGAYALGTETELERIIVARGSLAYRRPVCSAPFSPELSVVSGPQM